MKVQELLNEAKPDPSFIEAIKKAVMMVSGVRHIDQFNVTRCDGTMVEFEGLYEFPEHLVRGPEIKKAGKPFVKTVLVERGELWKEQEWAAIYHLDLTRPMTKEEEKQLKKELNVRK